MPEVVRNAQSLSASKGALNLGIDSPLRSDFTQLLDHPLHWDAFAVTAKALDRVHDRLRGSLDDVELAMTDLLSTLWAVKCATEPEVWDRVGSQCLAHPVRELIHQDPFASRCFNKPRGYAGDAVLIDYLYTRSCRLSESDDVSPLGERIFQYTRDISAGHAVRRRRDLMATIIDDICQRVERPHILSVACGHLREATLARSLKDGRHGRFVALDQDEQSLQLVDREVGSLGISSVCASIKALFRGTVADEKFDLIYTTGLYDYLDDRIGGKLTQRMFEMLNPGGRLVVANFMPGTTCSAYMDALLDWKLIYRTPEQMMALSSAVSEKEIASRRTYIEENQNIVFLDITRN